MPHSIETFLTQDPHAAAAYIRRGELAAFPTETVYGLGADVFNQSAVQAIFEAKGRPADNPLIAHIAHTDQLSSLVRTVTPIAGQLIEAFFPGPLTVILPAKPEVPSVVRAGLDTLAVRMPAHPLALEFLRACDTPVAAPSANRSGSPSPTTWEAVHQDLDGRIACILQGARAQEGLESTVVDCTSDNPAVLRDGAIPIEAIQQVCTPVVRGEHAASQPAKSPGMKYRHYAPRANVVVVAAGDVPVPSPHAGFIGLSKPDAKGFGTVQTCENVAQYAFELFHFFRTCDARGLKRIYCEAVPEAGLGNALMDRIRKAAAR